MDKILFCAPVSGTTGGISVWAHEMLNEFQDSQYQFVCVDNETKLKNLNSSKITRFYYGFIGMCSILWRTYQTIKNNPDIKLMHATTSGGYGSIRDYFLAKLCHRYGIRCIMHCRYGCITEDYNASGFWSRQLHKALKIYDNIWVLDKRSYNTLHSDIAIRDKVYLTPNSIKTPTSCDLKPKTYKSIAFIAHLFPSKGIFELVEAVSSLDMDITLYIAGPGDKQTIDKIIKLGGDKIGQSIHILGKLKNDKARDLMKSVDVLALPTYYNSEGFPISIIEAMSFGKMVISCSQAAIPDMLTDVDGNLCGILVEKKSSIAIRDAIVWLINNSSTADAMCSKAFDKVKNDYDVNVIYALYRKLYKQLLTTNIQ